MEAKGWCMMRIDEDTLPVLDLLAKKIGFLSEDQFVLGKFPLPDIISFPDPKGKVYVRLENDGNPNRSFLDLQILIFKDNICFYRICGEDINKVVQQKIKINLSQVSPTYKDGLVKKFLEQEWKKIKKTIKKKKKTVYEANPKN